CFKTPMQTQTKKIIQRKVYRAPKNSSQRISNLVTHTLITAPHRHRAQLFSNPSQTIIPEYKTPRRTHDTRDAPLRLRAHRSLIRLPLPPYIFPQHFLFRIPRRTDTHTHSHGLQLDYPTNLPFNLRPTNPIA